jgi:hypothetical protein
MSAHNTLKVWNPADDASPPEACLPLHEAAAFATAALAEALEGAAARAMPELKTCLAILCDCLHIFPYM